jgi:1,2-diacylglycerol 3-alpha-glucosyltransferase
MRIGIFTDTYPPYINGVSTSIQMLERALRRKGHQVFIVTVNPENMRYKKEKNIIRIPGIPTGIYDYRLTGIYPIRAVKTIKKWNLDVIHSHTEFGIGTFARIIAKQLNIPLVHTYHTMYEDYVHYITKGYFDGTSKKIVEHLTKFYCDKTAKELIVPTKKAYNLFKEKYKVEKNIHIIPTGIEIEKFYKENIDQKKLQQLKEELKIKKEDFIILYVGRLGQEKNVDFIIDNQKYFVNENKNVKLVIVGSGPDYDKYIEKAKKLNLQENIIFTGKVPYNKIQYYYNLGNIFVTASTTETQGLTLIEAMSTSMPVVCIDDDSFKNTIVDGLNGFLFKNEKEYKKIIDKLIQDKTLLKKIGQQAKMNASEYSSKYYGERVLDVYKKTIKENKSSKTFFGRTKDIFKKGLKK